MSLTEDRGTCGDAEAPRTPKLPIAGPRPPFDLESVGALEVALNSLPALTIETIPIWREALDAQSVTDDDLSRNGTYEFCDRRVPGPAGSPEVTLLISVPAFHERDMSVLFSIHGGGMIAGGRRTILHHTLDLAACHGMTVVSVDYRLAPEHPYPAAIEDCYAGLSWVAENATEIGIDPERIVTIGSSAGGGLAAGLSLLTRDRRGPMLFGQILTCPMLDDRNNTPSVLQLTGADLWDRVANQTAWRALLGDAQGTADVAPYASPARATDLSGLPPTLIDVGSAEIFRDEVVTYASRIWQQGGDAELHVWPGGYHGYEAFAPQARISQETKRAREGWLDRLLAP